MAEAYKLTILTPERQFYTGNVRIVRTTNLIGSFEVLSHHVPLVTVLQPTVTEFTDAEGKEFKAFTSTGILKVGDNEVTILCDACEWPEEIDKERAEAAKERAEKRLKGNEEKLDAQRAKLALVRAMTRLKVK